MSSAMNRHFPYGALPGPSATSVAGGSSSGLYVPGVEPELCPKRRSSGRWGPLQADHLGRPIRLALHIQSQNLAVVVPYSRDRPFAEGATIRNGLPVS